MNNMNNSNLSQKGKHHVRSHFCGEGYFTRAVCCKGARVGVGGGGVENQAGRLRAGQLHNH